MNLIVQRELKQQLYPSRTSPALLYVGCPLFPVDLPGALPPLLGAPLLPFTRFAALYAVNVNVSTQRYACHKRSITKRCRGDQPAGRCPYHTVW